MVNEIDFCYNFYSVPNLVGVSMHIGFSFYIGILTTYERLSLFSLLVILLFFLFFLRLACVCIVIWFDILFLWLKTKIVCYRRVIFAWTLWYLGFDEAFALPIESVKQSNKIFHNTSVIHNILWVFKCKNCTLLFYFLFLWDIHAHNSFSFTFRLVLYCYYIIYHMRT